MHLSGRKYQINVFINLSKKINLSFLLIDGDHQFLELIVILLLILFFQNRTCLSAIHMRILLNFLIELYLTKGSECLVKSYGHFRTIEPETRLVVVFRLWFDHFDAWNTFITQKKLWLRFLRITFWLVLLEGQLRCFLSLDINGEIMALLLKEGMIELKSIFLWTLLMEAVHVELYSGNDTWRMKLVIRLCLK
jgi:hypothetical protein